MRVMDMMNRVEDTGDMSALDFDEMQEVISNCVDIVGLIQNSQETGYGGVGKLAGAEARSFAEAASILTDRNATLRVAHASPSPRARGGGAVL